MNIKKLVKQGIIAALYVALTLGFSTISFGAIQFRVSSTMHQLAAYNKKYAIGLILGVIVANIFSPLGLIDVIAGVLTGLVGYGLSILVNKKVKKQIIKCIIVGVCVTLSTIFVAIELTIVYGLPLFATWLTVAIGQALTQIAGIPLFYIIDKKIDLKNYA